MAANMNYEIIIRRSFKCNRFEKGANTDTYEGLQIAEHNVNTNPTTQNQASFNKKLTEVKNYLEKALVYASAKRVQPNDRPIINAHLSAIQQATNTTDIDTEMLAILNSYNTLNISM